MYLYGPVEIPYFGRVVHRAGSEKVPTRVPVASPYCMGMFSEGVNTLCLCKVPYLHCGVSTYCRQLRSTI